MTSHDSDHAALVDRLAQARRPWLSPRLARWYPADTLDDLRRTSVEQAVSWLGDVEFGTGFRDAIGGVADERGLDRPPVTDPLAWAHRMLDLPGGGWCVTGIRYRGRDVEKPFVDVVATSEQPTPEALARIAGVLLPAYSGFAPLTLRVEAGDPDAFVRAFAGDERFASVTVDQYLVAAPAADLAGSAGGAVVLRPVPPLDAADRARYVAELYADVESDRPDLPRWATPSDVESLAEAAEEGLLLDVLVDGERAGLVAAYRCDARAVRGFVVEEIVLDRARRGRRLGPQVLRALAAALPADGGDLLWGDIRAGNEASLRNARAAGREVIGGHVWVTPAGLPGI